MTIDISIHAARVGCDKAADAGSVKRISYFNPRSPSGLRPEIAKQVAAEYNISIHAARVGCDNDKTIFKSKFN